MNGLEIADGIIAEHGHNIKIVAISASAFAHERERYLKAGCDDFISKPFRPEAIYCSLRNLLGANFVSREKLPEEAMEGEPVDFNQLRIPEELALRLATAAELKSATVLKNCLPEIEVLGPSGFYFARRLNKLLTIYDMEGIQQLVAQIRFKPEAALSL